MNPLSSPTCHLYSVGSSKSTLELSNDTCLYIARSEYADPLKRKVVRLPVADLESQRHLFLLQLEPLLHVLLVHQPDSTTWYQK